MCLSPDEVNSPREIVPVVLHLLGEEPIPSHPHVVCKSRRTVAHHSGARTVGMQLSAEFFERLGVVGDPHLPAQHCRTARPASVYTLSGA
jgi:hypothetical protein